MGHDLGLHGEWMRDLVGKNVLCESLSKKERERVAHTQDPARQLWRGVLVDAWYK
jgi:hypothetical protein